MLRENLFPVIKPFTSNTEATKDLAKVSKSFKPKSLGLGFYNGSWLSVLANARTDYEKAPYDFATITKAIDTDSYAKQAFLKYKDLFWKEGWDIVGENNEAVAYLYQRIDLIEEVQGKTFEELLVSVVDTLIKYHNCFLVKSYGNIDSSYINGGANRGIIGFYPIPIETAGIKRDVHNRPVSYEQRIVDGLYAGLNANPETPKWKAEEVIHFVLDQKEGYIFGTPAIISALDDIRSLRQIEQDILNLVHRELFPLYKYTVGTPDRPASEEELEAAAGELANLRVEGGLVVPERHDIEVMGAESNALRADPYLAHFKERVAIGLGVYPHHLGMATSGTNRSATDRLDTALYDRIKFIQSYVEGVVRIKIFNELLREGGFDPIRNPYSKETVSDRCYLKFREIDIDTQIKKENHQLNLFNGDAIDWAELREMLGRADDVDPMLIKSMIVHVQQISAQIEVLKATAQYMPKPVAATSSGSKSGSTGAAPKPKKPDAIPSSTGGVPNLPNFKKDTGNKVAPSNQHGRKFSPNVRRNDDIIGFNESLLEDLVDLIDGPNTGDMI